MIVVKVELHSAVTGDVTELGRMVIANDASQGNGPVGDYDVYLGRKGQTSFELIKKPQRKGKVLGHRRWALSVWRLVSKALHEIGHGAGKRYPLEPEPLEDPGEDERRYDAGGET